MLIPKTVWLAANLRIQTKLPIETVGQIISDRVFGGVPFGDGHLNLLNDTPALRLMRKVFGVDALLSGHPGKSGYVLQISQAEWNCRGIAKKDQEEGFIDLSNHIAFLLKKSKFIKVAV